MSDHSTVACEKCEKSDCSSRDSRPGETEEQKQERQELSRRLCRIKHKVMIMSGKGGVGKSTLSVNLAVALALEGKNVGLLDTDLHGPSIPTMLKSQSTEIVSGDDGLIPIEIGGLKVMSAGYLMKSSREALIWRGPMKTTLIRQLIKDVDWGDLDYLIIDSPPGTGDEPLSVCQAIENADGAVLVTTPQEVSAADVRRSVRFCHAVDLPILGIVENMSGFQCPGCGEIHPLFGNGGGEKLAEEENIPFLGAIPIDQSIRESCDEGTPFIYNYSKKKSAEAFQPLIQKLLAL